MTPPKPAEPAASTIVEVDGVAIAVHLAGEPDRPAIALLPGHPSGAHAYAGLIDRLATSWRVVAPDYPGYAASPVPGECPTFDRLAELTVGAFDAVGIQRTALYMFDFGAPVGMRIAEAQPGRITALVSQNGNIAMEGLGEPLGPLAQWWADRAGHQAPIDAFLSADGTRMQWAAGLREPAALNQAVVQRDVDFLAEPGRRAVAEALLWDYQTNPPRYRQWQAWLAEHRPPTLAIWGARDPFFVPAGAEAWRANNPSAEVVLLDTGHFALVEELDAIATHVDRLLTAANA